MVAFCPRCGTPRSGSLPICPGCAFDFRVVDSALSSAPEPSPSPATRASLSPNPTTTRGTSRTLQLVAAAFIALLIGGAVLLNVQHAGDATPTARLTLPSSSWRSAPPLFSPVAMNCPVVNSWGTPAPGDPEWKRLLWYDACWTETRTGQAPPTSHYTPPSFGP
jgi:hypothetical protein